MDFGRLRMVGDPGWDEGLASDDCPDEGFAVVLHVYDLSHGMAAAMSPALLGRSIAGIWHTGVVVFGREWFFGGGLCAGPPSQTPFGTPLQRLPMGRSFVPRSVFRDFLLDATHTFNAGTYDLLHNNCNNFSSELCTLLVGQAIPAHITGLPAEVMTTPLGQMLRPLLDGLQAQLRGGGAGFPPPPPVPAPPPPALMPPATAPTPAPEPPPPVVASPEPLLTPAEAPVAAAPADGAFTITVKTVYQTSFAVAARPTDTVAHLKRTIAAQEGYVPDSIKLVWTNQRILIDTEILGEIGVPAKPVLVIAARKAQPANPPKTPPSITGAPNTPPAAEKASHPVVADTGLTEDLVAMGFERAAVVQALQTTNNDMDRAVEKLVANTGSASASAPVASPAPSPSSSAAGLADTLQQLLSQASAAPSPPGASPADLAAAARLSELGFPTEVALEAYLVCDRREDLAAEYLFTHGAEAVAEQAAAAAASAGVSGGSDGERRIAGSLQSGRRLVLVYEDKQAQAKALARMPIAFFEERAQERLRAGGPEVTSSGQPLGLRDLVMKELLRWFKEEFFRWLDKAPCETCGADTQNCGGAAPSAVEQQTLWAGNTELYKCSKGCAAITRFPRINNPCALLETRRGRCGEWANCFCLCSRALGFETRWVQDFTDHVWAEFYSDTLDRWVHVDPCENAFDNPRMYESGWGKKLTYVIAHSVDEVVDVTRRYTDRWPEVLSRRNLVSEAFLADSIAAACGQIAAGLPPARQDLVGRRRQQERREWEGGAVGALQPGEQQPRETGSLEWRRQRGELGDDKS